MEDLLLFRVSAVADGVDQGFEQAKRAVNDLGEAYSDLAEVEEDWQKEAKETQALIDKSRQVIETAGQSSTKAAEMQKRASMESAKAKQSELEALLKLSAERLRDAQIVRSDLQAKRDYYASVYKGNKQNAEAYIELKSAQDEVAQATKRLNEAESENAKLKAQYQTATNQVITATRQHASALKELEAEERAAAQAQSDVGNAQVRAQQTAMTLVGAVFALKAIYSTLSGVLDACTAAYTRNESAMTGLQSIANGTGQSMTALKSEINELIADGLMPMESATLGLKNLLSRGFSTKEAVDIMKRLKDSAAFGRQAHLDLGQAVASATEGIKNENSVLVDNAGVTKNVSKMWKDYAASIGKSVQDLSLAEKRQAEYNGIMEETRFQVGDAKKLAGSYSGAQASLTAATERLKVSLGQANAVGIAPFGKGLGTIVSTAAEFTTALNPLVSGVLLAVKAMAAAGVASIAFGGGLKAMLTALTAELVKQIPALSAASGMWSTFWAAVTGPVGIVVGVVAALVGIGLNLAGSLETANEAAARLNDELKELSSSNSGAEALITRFEELSNKQQRTSDETAEMKRISEELVSTYGYRADGVNAEGRQVATNLELMKDQLAIAKELEEAKRTEAKEASAKAYEKAIDQQNKALERQIALKAEIERLEAAKTAKEKGDWGGIDYQGLGLMQDDATGLVNLLEVRLPAAMSKYKDTLNDLSSANNTFAEHIGYMLDDAKTQAGEKAAEIPEAVWGTWQTIMQEMAQQGEDVSGMADNFVSRYFAIDPEATVEQVVPELLSVKDAIMAAASMADEEGAGGSEAISPLVSQLIGDLNSDETLTQLLEQGKALRAKLDEGIATEEEASQFDQIADQLKAKIENVRQKMESAFQQMGLSGEALTSALDTATKGMDQLANYSSASAKEMLQSRAAAEMANSSIAEVGNTVVGISDDFAKMNAEIQNLQGIEAAVAIVREGAEGTDLYAEAVSLLADEYGMAEDAVAGNLDAIDNDVQLKYLAQQASMAAAQASLTFAEAMILSTADAAGNVSADAQKIINSIHSIRDALNEIDGAGLQLDVTDKQAVIKAFKKRGSGAFGGRGRRSGGGGGGGRRSGGGGGRRSSAGSGRASSAASKKNEALERELKLLEQKKKMDQLTTAEEIAGLEAAKRHHAKTAEERQDLDERIYQAKKKLRADDLAYKKAMDQLTTREEINLLNKQMATMKAGTDAHRQLEQQVYNLRKQLRREEYDLAVHYGKLTLEQQAVFLQQEVNQYKKGTKARLDAEKELYDKKLAIRQRDAQAMGSLVENVKTALKNRYDESRRLEEERIQKSISAWQDWADAQTEAIQRQIKALDELSKSEDREEEDRKRRRNIEATRQKLQYENDEYNRRKLQEELMRQEAEYSKWKRKLDREDLKQSLNEQAKAAQDRAQQEQKALSDLLAKNQAYYESLTTEEALNNEVRRRIGKGQEAFLAKLLKEHAPNYNALGISLGEEFVNGFTGHVKNIKNWIDDINRQVFDYQQKLIKVADQAREAYWRSRDKAPGSPPKADAVDAYKKEAPVLHVYFNQPVESPAEVSRELQRLAERLAKDL